MKIYGIALSVASLSVMMAQDTDPKLQQWMKSTNAQMGALRKMETKTGPEAAESATKLAAIYADLSSFWSARNSPDAVKISDEGKSSADALAAAAKAGDADKANAAFKGIGATCKSCHDTHRDKAADGSYKIK